MTKHTPTDELDAAIATLLADPGAAPPRVNPRLAELVRIAADLQQLPRAGFKARLAAALAATAPAAAGPILPASNVGPVLTTGAEISAQLAEIAKGPTLQPYDLREAFTGLPELTMRFFGALDECTLGVSYFSTPTHWERHPAG